MVEIKKGFKGFAARFPKKELPFLLTPDAHLEFARKNKPLSNELAALFLSKPEDEPISEYVEFVPCFRLPESKKLLCVVYWKADLLEYRYMIATFSTSGELIAKEKLSGTKVEKDAFSSTVTDLKSTYLFEIMPENKNTPSGQDASPKVLFRIEIDPDTGSITRVEENLHL